MVYIGKGQEYWNGRRKRRKKLRAELQKKYRKTLRGHVTKTVGSIVYRCTNSNDRHYKNYGGRGIRCLFTSQELYDWLIENNIDPRGLDIHRINNDGDYVLDNIEFLAHNKHAKFHNPCKA